MATRYWSPSYFATNYYSQYFTAPSDVSAPAANAWGSSWGDSWGENWGAAIAPDIWGGSWGDSWGDDWEITAARAFSGALFAEPAVVTATIITVSEPAAYNDAVYWGTSYWGHAYWSTQFELVFTGTLDTAPATLAADVTVTVSFDAALDAGAVEFDAAYGPIVDTSGVLVSADAILSGHFGLTELAGAYNDGDYWGPGYWGHAFWDTVPLALGFVGVLQAQPATLGGEIENHFRGELQAQPPIITAGFAGVIPFAGTLASGPAEFNAVAKFISTIAGDLLPGGATLAGDFNPAPRFVGSLAASVATLDALVATAGGFYGTLQAEWTPYVADDYWVDPYVISDEKQFAAAVTVEVDFVAALAADDAVLTSGGFILTYPLSGALQAEGVTATGGFTATAGFSGALQAADAVTGFIDTGISTWVRLTGALQAAYYTYAEAGYWDGYDDTGEQFVAEVSSEVDFVSALAAAPPVFTAGESSVLSFAASLEAGAAAITADLEAASDFIAVLDAQVAVIDAALAGEVAFTGSLAASPGEAQGTLLGEGALIGHLAAQEALAGGLVTSSVGLTGNLEANPATADGSLGAIVTFAGSLVAAGATVDATFAKTEGFTGALQAQPAEIDVHFGIILSEFTGSLQADWGGESVPLPYYLAPSYFAYGYFGPYFTASASEQVVGGIKPITAHLGPVFTASGDLAAGSAVVDAVFHPVGKSYLHRVDYEGMTDRIDETQQRVAAKASGGRTATASSPKRTATASRR